MLWEQKRWGEKEQKTESVRYWRYLGICLALPEHIQKRWCKMRQGKLPLSLMILCIRKDVVCFTSSYPMHHILVSFRESWTVRNLSWTPYLERSHQRLLGFFENYLSYQSEAGGETAWKLLEQGGKLPALTKMLLDLFRHLKVLISTKRETHWTSVTFLSLLSHWHLALLFWYFYTKVT